MSSVFKEFARRLAARGYAFLLARNSTVLPAPTGAILVVAPHPDDETLGCGGLIAQQAAAGRQVRVVFVTDGEASHRGHPILADHHIGRIRRGEALAALTSLGVADAAKCVVFLEAPDGELDRLSSERRRMVSEALIDEIRATKPAVVCVPYRAGGSSEHTAVFDLTVAACATAGGGMVLEYPVWAWWNALRLRPRLAADAENFRLPLGRLRATKRRALACHRSQVEPTPPWTAPQLPPALTAACCGANEFYFARQVAAERR